MNTAFVAIAASLALTVAANGHAQSSAGTPATTPDGAQSQAPAGAPPGQPASKQQIGQTHKAAMQKCNGLQENAKDICKAEADGQKKIAEAEARLAGHDSPKNRFELEKVRAEAAYKVAKEKCDDEIGDAKKACVKQAKATQDS